MRLAPPARDDGAGEGDPDCVAVALPEMDDGCASSAAASPPLATVTATSMEPPTAACAGVATTDVTVSVAGFWTVAGPAAAGPAAFTAVPAFASDPLADAVY